MADLIDFSSYFHKRHDFESEEAFRAELEVQILPYFAPLGERAEEWAAVVAEGVMTILQPPQTPDIELALPLAPSASTDAAAEEIERYGRSIVDHVAIHSAHTLLRVALALARS